MSKVKNVADATNNLPSNDEDAILESKKGRYGEGELESGGLFWGTLNGFTEHRLFFTGEHGQSIIIKRRRVARLEMV
jgi:hypothetical protein